MQISKVIVAYIQSKRYFVNFMRKMNKILPQVEFCWCAMLEAEWHQTRPQLF